MEEWSTSHPSHFTPKKRTPITNSSGSGVMPKTSLNTRGKRKISWILQELNPNSSIDQSVLSLYTIWAILASILTLTNSSYMGLWPLYVWENVSSVMWHTLRWNSGVTNFGIWDVFVILKVLHSLFCVTLKVLISHTLYPATLMIDLFHVGFTPL